MKTIFSSPYNKALSGSFTEQFEVDRAGIYVIEITVSAKSWWQNMTSRRSFSSKDSLTVALDRSTAISSVKKKKIFADDLWNGNVLKGHEHTVYLFAYLKTTSHILSFDVRGKPWIKGVVVSLLEDQVFSLKNVTVPERDRIPWMTCSIGDGISLVSISLTARVAKRSSRDDDDLSLMLDAKTIRNEDPRTHKEWYWCGKALQGNAKTFAREFRPSIAPNRLDLVVDGAPVIDELTCMFRESHSPFPRRYVPGPQGEDYNAYDDIISDAVLYWNKEFLAKNNPVLTPLDPSLIKAIAYIESRLGYASDDASYSAYPDIMQVGGAQNPALHTLRSEKEFEEYEWDDAQGIPAVVAYAKADIHEPKDSVRWGVRWLYHKAQYIENNQRKWRSWEDAVELYHKKGDTTYRKNVLSIYRQGRDQRDVVLWMLLFLGLAVLGGGPILGMMQQERGIDASVLSRKMKNGTYTIDGKSIHLRDGAYFVSTQRGETPKNPNPYDSEKGPYSVVYEGGAVGDMNGDGVRDAVAVLSANYGGTGQYIHLAALLSEKNRMYRHSGSVVYDDRDAVRSLSINRGSVHAESIVHKKNDPLCCPSQYVTREFTLADFTVDL